MISIVCRKGAPFYQTWPFLNLNPSWLWEMRIKAEREQDLPQTAPFSSFEWQGGEFSALVLLKQQRAKALSYRRYRCPMRSCGRYGSKIAFRSFVSADFQSGLDECKPPMRLWVHSVGRQRDTPVYHVVAFSSLPNKAKEGIVAAVGWFGPPVLRLCFAACLLFSVYQILSLCSAATLQEPSVYQEMESWWNDRLMGRCELKQGTHWPWMGFNPLIACSGENDPF